MPSKGHCSTLKLADSWQIRHQSSSHDCGGLAELLASTSCDLNAASGVCSATDACLLADDRVVAAAGNRKDSRQAGNWDRSGGGDITPEAKLAQLVRTPGHPC